MVAPPINEVRVEMYIQKDAIAKDETCCGFDSSLTDDETGDWQVTATDTTQHWCDRFYMPIT